MLIFFEHGGVKCGIMGSIRSGVRWLIIAKVIGGESSADYSCKNLAHSSLGSATAHRSGHEDNGTMIMSG